MNKTLILICTLIVINLITFILFTVDKRKAIKGKWRISEKALLLWSLFAPWGGFAGMKLMHHKTKHKKFTISIPVFMILHVLLAGCIIYTSIE